MKNIKFVVKPTRCLWSSIRSACRSDTNPDDNQPEAGTADGKTHCGRRRSISAKLALRTGIEVSAGQCLVSALRTVRECQPSSDHIQRSKPQ